MDMPCYIDLAQARAVLSDLGLSLSERQMKRAAEADAQGRRKLPVSTGAKVGQMSGCVVLSRGGVKPGHWLG